MATLLCGALATPLFSCGGSGGDNSPTEKTGKANVISSSLLDGKIANLMSANGIAIQDKTQTTQPTQATPLSAKGIFSRSIVASADESSVVEQSKTELVKQTEDGVQDVHFHDSEKGEYTEWNDGYDTHHHDGEVCTEENCVEISDEVLAEEENAPTVISLDARVNKLYNTGKFTFLCVSSAVEGQVELLTMAYKDSVSLSMTFFHNYGAYLNSEDHYYSEENRSRVVSYMRVQAGDKKGVILVKRSDAEEGYHYANYWSDDFNQSYIIDNETGKTYSLAELPHIYSVQNGVIVTKTDTTERLYTPKIDEKGELVLDEIIVPAELKGKYPATGYLADIHGNVVFRSNQYLQGGDIYGEVKEGGFIFTGINQQVYDGLRNGGNRQYSEVKVRAYAVAKRYLVGNDGQIYRFDFRGEFNSVPVHVLNADGEWVDVPKTAHVVFSDADSFFTEITIKATNRQYLLITQIKNGKTYFSNSAYGTDLMWTRNTYFNMYSEAGYFVGITALPTDGSADTEMQAFIEETREKAGLDDKSIVYRVGATAFAYEDKAEQELVIWDRETETRQTIGVGPEIENFMSGSHIGFLQDRNAPVCFQANTVSGTYYISYDEKNPTKAWNEYSTTPIEKTENLDAYYQLILNKLKK